MSNSEQCGYFRRPLTEKLAERLEKALNTEPVFTKYEEARIKFEAECKEIDDLELSDSEGKETHDQVTFTDRNDLKRLLDDFTDSENEDDPKLKENRIKFLLKMHKYRKKILKSRKIPELERYLYYGSGLLMENDTYYLHMKQLKQKYKLKKKRNELLKKKNLNNNEKAALNETKVCTSIQLVKNGCIDNLSSNDKQSINYVNCNGYTKSSENSSQLNSKDKNITVDIKNKDNIILNYNCNDKNNNNNNQKTCTITSNSNSNISNFKNKITSHLVTSKPIVPLPTVLTNTTSTSIVSNTKRHRVKRDVQQMTIKRQKVYLSIIKKDILKLQKSRINFRKDAVNINKKLAYACQKHVRQKALQSQRNSKEAINRAKKLNREVQSLWRVQDRADRETEKRLKKEVEEQRRIDNEMLEARRQQRKLNFLITQTELYAHFMSKKFHDFNEEQFIREQQRILNQLDEDVQNSITTTKDGYDVNHMKMIAEKNVIEAFRCENERTQYFERYQMISNDLPRKLFPLQQSYSILNCSNLKRHQGSSTTISPIALASSSMTEFITDFFPQPNLFKGVLKCYQLKGVNWLAKLYNQKISGILADEMGLGKTIQSIAFLCHIAENYGVWGPFLIISPASTLHNWQQELEKFAPDFKIVPYWGSPNDRKVLRQFWDSRGIQNKLSSFHIVVTSYQIVITDIKYFNKIRWQYMILDEAQAIKSSSSIRWKLLLSFNCRNRLLLSGTPIQNSMAELWALLHFIMPTLFDSHDEFNEWFSKDIENCAENRTGIDERHLSRLHMILKPFMLRRIKKDVENELSDKIEIMLYCPLSLRQNFFYTSLKNKILNEDLLCSFEKNPSDKSVASNLMNFVMQFRKVCNHPDLFEKRVQNGQYFQEVLCYQIPKLMYEFIIDSHLNTIPSIFDIYSCLNIYHSLFKKFESTFSFIRFLNINIQECNRIFNSSLVYRLKNFLQIQDILSLLRHRHFVWNYTNSNHMFYCILKNLYFNEFDYNIKFFNNEFYKFTKIVKPASFVSSSCISLPKIFLELVPKIISKNRKLYTYDKRAEIHSNNYLQSDEYEFCLNFTHKIVNWCKMPNLEKETFVNDAGKLTVLDSLLRKLKKEDHRVLIYSQMTKMIDLLEEFMFYRKYKYIRLDGSSKISDRRDMVADFQARSDIFVFLLSTRAGGLGINLTAADTVIFYDSDWNPTVDQQAMDRAHRLGQTKQVTVYRLICKNTIEETILQKATEKNEMQKMVISGGDCKPDFLNSKHVASLLLDDVELEEKCVNLMQSREKNCEKFMKRKCDKNIIESSKSLKKPKLSKELMKCVKDETSPTLTRKIKYKRRHNSRGRPKRVSKQLVNKSPKDKDKRTSIDFKYRSPKKNNALRKGPGRPKISPKQLIDISCFNCEHNQNSNDSLEKQEETDSNSIKINSLGKFDTHLTNIQFSSMKY